jgi:hypothetical protein
MKKVALVIASLGMVSGVAVAHHGGSHALSHHGGPHSTNVVTASQMKAESGFRFAVGTSKVKKLKSDNCHAHDGVVHCHD